MTEPTDSDWERAHRLAQIADRDEQVDAIAEERAGLLLTAARELDSLHTALRAVLALADELDADARTDRETVLWVTKAFRDTVTAALGSEFSGDPSGQSFLRV